MSVTNPKEAGHLTTINPRDTKAGRLTVAKLLTPREDHWTVLEAALDAEAHEFWIKTEAWATAKRGNLSE